MTIERVGGWRLPLIAVASVALALVVVAAILLLGTLVGGSGATPTPTATDRLATESPADTPEAAVRAFFDAFAEARESNNADLIEPYVTDRQSSAYQTTAAFISGQQGLGKASVTTVSELSGFSITEENGRAVVEFTYVAGGYDIDADTREPLETPVILPAERVRAVVLRIGDRWLVESYEAIQ